MVVQKNEENADIDVQTEIGEIFNWHEVILKGVRSIDA